MVRTLSTDERIWLTNEFAQTGNKCQTLRNWPYPTPTPNRKSLQTLIQKFETHGTVQDLKKSERPRSVLTPLNVRMVQQVYLNEPKNSVRRTSSELGIGAISVFKMLKTLKMKEYLPTLVQELQDGDFIKR